MLSTVALLAMMSAPGTTDVATAVWQVSPYTKAEHDGQPVELKKTRGRAVVLVHGLMLHPIAQGLALKPALHDWQHAKSGLVQALAPDFDVFAFSYSQTGSVDAVASSVGLQNLVRKLKRAGYDEIVLLGHSAGGLVARHFAERFPDSGVTKVIQVAAPNFGAELAGINFGVSKLQLPFVRSLAPRPRMEFVLDCPKLSEKVEFCCVVCKLWGLPHDTLVSLDSQWPRDLQEQGVPATLVGINHFDAMKGPHAVAALRQLALEKLVRWSPEQVEQGRQVMFGKAADAAALAHPESKNRPLLRVVGKKFSER